MKSIEEVRRDVQERYGLSFSNQTWWAWNNAGLIPNATKIAGRGNAMFMPDDASVHIGRIRLLSELGISQKAMKEWAQAKAKKTPLTGTALALEIACRVLDATVGKTKLTSADLKRLRSDLNALFTDLGG